MKTIIWTDKETGGLDPASVDTTQIAAILDVDGEAKEEFNVFLRPSDPSRVNPEALAVQGKTLEQVTAHPLSQKEGFEQWRATLERWTAQGKAIWGGQNTPFDIKFSKALFAANGDPDGLKKYFEAQTVDLRALVDELRGSRKFMVRNAKLGTVCEALGIAFEAHNAIHDIRATRRAYYELVKRHYQPA